MITFSLMADDETKIARRRVAVRLAVARHRRRQGAAPRPFLRGDEPWQTEGVSRATWFRRQAQAPSIRRVRPVYYGDNDPVAGHVLRELIKAQVIPPGEVDERSIEEVQPDDTRGFRHCHFFAGGGGWAIAAQMASWPEEKPLWTGSPPCQSFSKAGTRRGRDDPRHLWPHYYRLVRTIRPSVIAFEQVSSKAGYAWLDGVRDNLRGSGYAVEAFDIAAAAVGAPQILQRLYGIGLLAHPESLIGGASSLRDIANREAGGERPEPNPCDDFLKFRGASLSEQFWREAELRKGQNGEFRRVKPGLRLLAHGLPGRVDANRLVGNSIVPPLAAQVLAAVLDVLRDGTGDQHSS